MRVFVAGASGVIGRELIPRLVAAGHEVTGMTRSEQRAERIRAAGARASVCDALDAPALMAAVAAAEPEVVVHQLTELPQKMDPKNLEAFYGSTNRLRTEGTANLMAAAKAAGARRVVSQSIAFIYAPEGGAVKDERAPTLEDAPGAFGDGVRAVLDGERQVQAEPGIDGLVLRYGWFYGPGTYFARDGYQSAEVARRRMPVVGKGTGVWSFVHVADAADATVAAVERGPAGIYNVVDDEPAPMREWVPVLADALGAKKPFRVPVWLAKLAAPRPLVEMATSLRGASNAKARRELGWEPAHASWRDGFAASL